MKEVAPETEIRERVIDGLVRVPKSSHDHMYDEFPPKFGLLLLKTSVNPDPSVPEALYPLFSVSKSIVVVCPKPLDIKNIIGKKNLPNLKFDIRFHLDPSSKVMKTQDNKSILIEIADEGWKFNCNNYDIDIDNGLYFGKKNTHIDNQNIFITGIISEKNTNIKWELTKI